MRRSLFAAFAERPVVGDCTYRLLFYIYIGQKGRGEGYDIPGFQFVHIMLISSM